MDRYTVQTILTKLDTNAITLKEAKAFCLRFGTEIKGHNKQQFIKNLLIHLKGQ